jgi:hypothetical protein
MVLEKLCTHLEEHTKATSAMAPLLPPQHSIHLHPPISILFYHVVFTPNFCSCTNQGKKNYPHTSHFPIIPILHTFQSSPYFTPSNYPHTSHLPIIPILHTFQSSPYFTPSNHPHTSHLPIILILHTFQLSPYFTHSNYPHTSHLPIIPIIHTFQLSPYFTPSKNE